MAILLAASSITAISKRKVVPKKMELTKSWPVCPLDLQSHMGRLPAPISDYVTDLRGVLDNSTRVLQALVDCAAEAGLLSTTLAAIRLVQGITQVCACDCGQ